MAQRKKIKQGQSRWLVWVTATVKRGDGGPAGLVSDGQQELHVQRCEVVWCRGSDVMIKMGDLGNTTIMSVFDFKRSMATTYRKAVRFAQAAARSNPKLVRV